MTLPNDSSLHDDRVSSSGRVARTVRWASILGLGLAAILASCARGNLPADSDVEDGNVCEDDDCSGTGGSSDGSGGSSGNTSGQVTDGPFELRADFTGPCEIQNCPVDVNLGNTAESTVRALHCQILGTEPDAAVLTEWTGYLTSRNFTRRVDVARTFCQWASRDCDFRYTDPWNAQSLLEDGCTRKTTRDLGAVFMFFNVCPGGVNCGMNWANTHAVGMNAFHVLYAHGDNEAGYYTPTNSGFWHLELLDARWAGLQFLLLNVYGPDIIGAPNALDHLEEALADVSDIQIGLFDDTWVWGRGSPAGNLGGVWGNSVDAPYNAKPNWDDIDGAAQVLYAAKWTIFFEGVPKERWYTREGKPFIYFYNAGTFHDKSYNAPAIIARMKELFAADFGVEPFVVVDTAFFPDGANAAADGRFTWNSGAGRERSSFTLGNGVRIDHSMVRWDEKNRGAQSMTDVATAEDRIFKGPDDLETFLTSSADADVAVLATWNDLGEGTGINRNYDYFHGGRWLEPSAFMSLTRQAQCSN